MKNIITLCIFNLLFYVVPSFAGDRLLATGGVTQIEGSAGGGLNPWALISGYGTDTQIGASAYYTELRTNGGFELSSGGVSIGLYNRVEVSLSQQKFGLSNTVPGESIRLDTLGVKVRVLGDAIYDQDNWVPQIAAGIQIKHNEDFSFVPKLLGAKKSSSVDVYVSATKLYLAAINGRNVLLNATLLATEANQFGILGFGGDKHDGYRIEPAVSLALMLTDNILLGTEYRAKPNNLSSFKEDDANDLFVTWFPMRNLSVTAAYVDLGNIADKDNQRAWYLSGQISY
jgi:hypothetical protein